MFSRVLRAELLKLKRTVALRLAVIAPLVVVSLMFFIASQMPLTMLRRRGMESEWVALTRMNLVFWALLMLPLYITVEAALLAGLDHADCQWKALLTRPVPRSAFYLAKLTVLAGLIALSTLILIGGVVGSGLLLPYLQSTARFDGPVPALAIAISSVQMTVLAVLALSVQHWVSLKWRSFAVSTGFGITMMVFGYGMVAASQPNGGVSQWFPWSLPMLVVAAWRVDLPIVTLIATSLAGAREFSRRELQ
jgi:lantibiotic transport system permease protein